MTALRVVFAGTPEFARPALLELIARGYQVIAAFTQPDRPAGRGRLMTKSPVRLAAEQAGIPVFTPPRGADLGQALQGLGPVDVMVVAAYGLLLPPEVLRMPRLGCLNIHASLLPRWRGAAPVARAIEAGDTMTGITIMQMDEGLDTGPMVAVATVPIGPEDTTERLTARLAEAGAQLLCDTLPAWAADHVPATPQPAAGRSYARKLQKAEAPLDWRESATVLERRIRAFAPWPGTTAQIGETVVKVTGARVAAGEGVPGRILAVTDEVVVATGAGALALTRIQQPGKPVQPAGMVARRLDWRAGATFAADACARP